MNIRLMAATGVVLVLVAGCDSASPLAEPVADPAAAVAPAAEAAEPATPEAKILVGTEGDDALVGGGGHDHLTGGLGADTLDGKDGFDYTRYDDALEGVVVSLADNAKNAGEAKGDVFVSLQGVVGSAHRDDITGSDETNDLHGLAGNDSLAGLDGSDGMEGGDGEDVLDGGPGKDTYLGGPGNDTFVFQSGQADGDIINDFEGAGPETGDKLVLKNYGKGATFTKGSDDNWVVTSADGKVVETIKIVNGALIDGSDFAFQ